MTAKKLTKSRKDGVWRLSNRLRCGLAGLVLALAALGSYWLTDRFILPQDNLARLVPSTAISYLHADLSSPTAGSAAALETPSGLKPDEAARFAMADSRGQIKSGWLLYWKDGQPSPDDLNKLAGNSNAYRTWDQVWLMGDQTLQADLKEAVRTGSSLANDPFFSRALGYARDLAPLQFLFNPTGLPSGSLTEPTASLATSLPPLVGAARNLSLDGATIMPINRQVSQLDRPKIADLQVTAPTWRSASQLAYAGTGQTAHWTAVVFGRINVWRLTSGLDATALPNPLDLHGGQVELEAFDSGQIGDQTRSPRLQVRLINDQASQVADRISRYLDEALPSRKPIFLPDKDQVVELILEPSAHKMIQSIEDPNLWEYHDSKADFDLYLRQDHQDVIISDFPIEQQKSPEIKLNYGKCARIGGNQLIIRGNILNDIWEIIGIQLHSQDNLRLFIENKPNLWITCRLTSDFVDK